ncbi:IS3 family transposase [Rhodococcus sp. C3V]|uniref:IS3 family transposase n=1 Tax=Rhodococcus sp. C3V TaxID=3034165 RepID=UPI0023E1437C|nr:IS3 family transposase [Rhodococcus sp. C3V]MDF3319739.1 IS3 family transposase [Rhodococcus sp. C3V]
MAGCKRHTPQQIIRKLCQGDELAASGADIEQIARQLDVSVPTLYNWRKQYGGMKADDAKEFKELKNENALLKKLLAEAELEKATLKEIARGKFLSPTARRNAVTMLQETMGLSQRFACKIVGQPRSTQRKELAKNTPDDPDADLRKWLRDWAKANQRKGFRRAWADLRAPGWVINKKKVQRLWREEGLRVKIRKRAGASTTPITEANALKVVWAIDSQFDSTTDRRKFKIASMVDEHTRHWVFNVVERSIPAEDLVAALEKAFALWGGPPQIPRCDNGPEFISESLRAFCADQVGIGYVPPGQPWKNGYIESFNNRVRDECLNMDDFHSVLEARVVIEGWKEDYYNRHRHSPLVYRTPNEYAAICIHTH